MNTMEKVLQAGRDMLFGPPVPSDRQIEILQEQNACLKVCVLELQEANIKMRTDLNKLQEANSELHTNLYELQNAHIKLCIELNEENEENHPSKSD